MADDPRETTLRLLVAELEEERLRIEKLVAEFDHAAKALAASQVDRLVVYGVAALLESFYTGVEKALHRIASKLGGLPSGVGWHRELLESMTLDIDALRPRVLSEDSARELDAYLAFRHRFRNLYVFDLEREPMAELLRRGSTTWQRVDRDLEAFIARLRGFIQALEQK